MDEVVAPIRRTDQALAARLTEKTRLGAIKVPRVIMIGAIVLTMAVVGVVGALLYQARERAMEAAHVLTRTIAHKVDERMARIVAATETVMRVAAHDPAAIGMGTLDVAPYMEAIPELISFEIRRGRAGTETRRALGALLSQRNGTGMSIMLGRPSIDGLGRWVISLFIESEEPGSGVAMVGEALLSLDMIREALAAQPVGRNGTVSLLRSDGVILLRYPEILSQVGQALPQAHVISRARQMPFGSFEAVNVVDGVERVVAYRVARATPLIVVASMAKGEVLTPWAADASRFAIVMVVMLVVFLLAAIAAAKQASRGERLEQESRRQSEILRATLDTMDQGIIMVDGAMKVRVWNPRVNDILDLPADLMKEGLPFSDIISHQDASGEFARMAPAERDRFMREAVMKSYERDRPDGTTVEIRTTQLPMGGVVRTYTDITKRKRTENRISHLAHHDTLTDLPNRSKFSELLAEALGRGEPIAVIYFDLDGFKAVNDTLGHAAGDELLMALARRLRKVVGERGVLARLGGDEFTAIIPAPGGPEEIEALGNAIIATTADPFRIANATVKVGLTVGYALAPDDGDDPEAILRRADLALYEGKANARGTVRRFTSDLEERASFRRQLEADLRQAVDRGEFEMHYQPVAEAATLAISGFEALIRWRHPERGLVSPAEFIPIAEETGLIVDLGNFALIQACRDAISWPRDLRVRVNVSAVQIVRKTFVHCVVQILAETGLSPRRLEMEITESVLMLDDPDIRETLYDLQALGIRIAMDDFGTGYSSLSYLLNFPFDSIKIDRSFVKDLDVMPERIAIVETIAQLALRMGIKSVAEGIETQEQLVALRKAGVQEFQGFLIGRPRPIKRSASIRAA